MQKNATMWYYMLNNQRMGPVDDSAMRALLAAGTIHIDTLVWTDGMPNWDRLSQTTLGSGMSLPPAAPRPAPPAYQPGQAAYAGAANRKDRVVYILLAVLLGFGVHNFYAGYKRNGLIQILCSFLSCGALWIFMWIWSVIEACTVTVDADGVPFK